MNIQSLLLKLTTVLATVSLFGCGGGGGGSSQGEQNSQEFTVSATVNGLDSGKQVTLQNNAGNSTTVSANGSFTFSTPVAYNGSYAVTVGTQPTGQTCTVSNGSGSGVVANVSNVSVTCSDVTIITGNIMSNTTLVSGTNYLLSGNVGVASGVTLTIQPGVVIYHDNGGFIISGNLVAVGNAISRIKFTTLPSDLTGVASRKYQKIEFNNSSNSRIEYMDFENGVTIDLNGSSVVPFRNSKFKNSSVAFTDTGGYQYMDIQNCTFEDNDNVFSGIRTSGADFLNNSFMNNDRVFDYGYYFGIVNVRGNNFVGNNFIIKAPEVGYGYGVVNIDNNWWGTMNATVIDGLIYDGVDLVTLQTLTYGPILSSPGIAGSN